MQLVMGNPFHRNNRLRALVGVVALLATQGCYAFRPLLGATPRVGERVRVELTPSGSMELARYLGPNVAVVEGDLSSIASDGTMMVAVDFVHMMNGVRQPWSGEGLVSIPAAYSSGLTQRTFLKSQSIFAGTVLTVVLIGIAIIALRAGGAGGGGDGNPPPPP